MWRAAEHQRDTEVGGRVAIPVAGRQAGRRPGMILHPEHVGEAYNDRVPSVLPLFSGAHVPAVRFARALDELRLMDAMEDCPPPWREGLGAMIEATELAGRHDLARLLAARIPGWPEELERTWQRLVGRRLDGRGIPSAVSYTHLTLPTSDLV